MFKTLMMIGTGGFLGTVSRYLITRFMIIYVSPTFPYGTLFVNITGCFLVGLVMGLSFVDAMSAGTKIFP